MLTNTKCLLKIACYLWIDYKHLNVPLTNNVLLKNRKVIVIHRIQLKERFYFLKVNVFNVLILTLNSVLVSSS